MDWKKELTLKNDIEFLNPEWLTTTTKPYLPFFLEEGKESEREEEEKRIEKILSLKNIGDESGFASDVVALDVSLSSSSSLSLVLKLVDCRPLSVLTGDHGFASREPIFYQQISHLLKREKIVQTPKYFGHQLRENGEVSRMVLEKILLDDFSWFVPPNGLSFLEAKDVVIVLARLHSKFTSQYCEDIEWSPRDVSEVFHGYGNFCRAQCLALLQMDDDDDEEEVGEGEEKKEKRKREKECNWEEKKERPKGESVIREVMGEGFDKEKVLSIAIQLEKEGVYDKMVKELERSDPFLRRMIHMDVRAGNMFLKKRREEEKEGEEGAESRVMFFDWQNVSFGNVGIDLVYFLSGSLSIETRRSHFSELLAIYCQEFLSFSSSSSSSLPSYSELQKRVWKSCEKASFWPLVWTYCTIGSFSSLAKTLAAGEEGQNKAKEFMCLTSRRYFQFFVDLNGEKLFSE